jgi:capsular polysaccharide transport system permease protein
MKDGSNDDYLVAPPRNGKAVARRAKRFLTDRKNIMRAALALCVGATVYWGLIASDRYVSEANVLIEHTNLTSEKTLDFGSLLGGGSGANRPDQLLMRSYLLSTDMMNKLDAKLHLRAHYSDHSHDVLSRLASPQVSQEAFYRYYLSRVSVEFDDYSGVLVIKAQAYDPRTAQAITKALLAEGEAHMNEIGHELAQSQVRFLESQVTAMAQRFEQARLAVLAYQNSKGTVSPESTAESNVGNINKLRATRVELETRRSALLAYLTPQAPGVVDLDVQLQAIDKQIGEEEGRLTGAHHNSLNKEVEEYQRLQLTAGFAEDVYKTALVGLEKGRVEATRTLKKVSVLEAPTLPDEALQPRRFYNMVTFVLVTMLVAGVLNLLAAIIRDHKD